MFSDKKERKNMEPSSSQNRINEGTLVQGDISSKGFFRIDGEIIGNVATPSKVVIGKSGKIEGTLTCKDADIEGSFDGNLHVSGTLSIKETAVISGDVIAGKLAVEPGASFNATCSMKDAQNSITSIETSKQDNSKPNPYDRQQRLKKSAKEEQN